MSKGTKIWLIVATSLILIGGVIFGGAMSMMNWNFSEFNTSKFETNEYVVDDKFDDISLDADTAHIEFLASDDDKCKVICYEETSAKHIVSVKNDTLSINIDNQKKWYEYIGFNLGTPKITVYMPKDEYGAILIKSNTGKIIVPEKFNFDSIDISLSTGDVSCFASSKNECKISTSTGDIEIKNITAGSLELSATTGIINAESIKCDTDIHTKVSTGKTILSDVECENITSGGSTGDIVLEDVISKENITVNRSTGDVLFDSCDASDVFVKTSTGSVKGSFLTDKIFIANSSTGKIDVPNTANGGRCEIITDTGDIKISVLKS